MTLKISRMYCAPSACLYNSLAANTLFRPEARNGGKLGLGLATLTCKKKKKTFMLQNPQKHKSPNESRYWSVIAALCSYWNNAIMQHTIIQFSFKKIIHKLNYLFVFLIFLSIDHPHVLSPFVIVEQLLRLQAHSQSLKCSSNVMFLYLFHSENDICHAQLSLTHQNHSCDEGMNERCVCCCCAGFGLSPA